MNLPNKSCRAATVRAKTPPNVIAAATKECDEALRALVVIRKTVPPTFIITFAVVSEATEVRQ